MDFVLDGNSNHLYDDLKKAMDKYGYAIIKNFFDKKTIKAKVKQFKANFDSSNDIRLSGPNRYKMKNYQRLDLGDYGGRYARFSRVITQFSWNKESIFFDEIEKLIKLRNQYMNMKRADDLTYNFNNMKMCDLPKILHYPIGGGFMATHPDINDGVINILISLSRRGEDFEKGGVYYIDNNKKFIDAEEILEVGDVYTHKNKTLHGVRGIDYDKPIDLHTLKGRLVLNLSCERFEFEK